MQRTRKKGNTQENGIRKWGGARGVMKGKKIVEKTGGGKPN